MNYIVNEYVGVHTRWLSYSMAVLYLLGIMVFCLKISPQNQPHISFTTIWQYWLDIAKLKIAFRTFTPSYYKNLTEFSTN